MLLVMLIPYESFSSFWYKKFRCLIILSQFWTKISLALVDDKSLIAQKGVSWILSSLWFQSLCQPATLSFKWFIDTILISSEIKLTTTFQYSEHCLFAKLWLLIHFRINFLLTSILFASVLLGFPLFLFIWISFVWLSNANSAIKWAGSCSIHFCILKTLKIRECFLWDIFLLD